MKIALAATAAVVALAGCAAANPLAGPTKNPGPCPRAYALYDASRVVDIKGEEKFENVGFTAEVQKVRSDCTYADDKPIKASVEIDFGFGRGPAAEGSRTTYTYWVAVTRKDIEVIAKEYFPVEVSFKKGEDRVYTREKIGEIVIPRAGSNISGANFEILVGFDLTEEQREFNSLGKRFLPDAVQ